MKPWRERIAEARERGAFTDADRYMAAENGWGTCAVGEFRAQYPEVIKMLAIAEEETPQDYSLRRNGIDFGLAVGMQEIDVAEILLDKIEDRVLELKRQKFTQEEN